MKLFPILWQRLVAEHTSFVACRLSGPYAAIVASGYLARESREAPMRFIIWRAASGSIRNAAAFAWSDAELPAARRSQPGESDGR
jgi:hypothetical protein